MTASTMRAPILVAPAAFGGTLRASQVAAALARGLEAGGWPVDPCPVADGGAGLLEVLLPALGGETSAVDVGGRAIGIGLIEDGGTALVELRAAVDEDADGSSAPAGELLLAADATGAEVLIAGAGDLVAADGGAGAVEAIATGGGLRARLVVLCDVRTATERVAEALAGAGELERATADRLDARLDALAGKLPRDPRGIAYGGAGGGLAGALWAACDAQLEGGASFVLSQLDFDARMLAARAVIVGEGRLDLGTLAGKAPGEIATRARQAGVPCFAAVGSRTLDAFGARILDLQAVLEASDAAALEAAGRRLATLV
ncbi:MAG TPA: glycerate kinase [Conexibacter sp.]|nr:glycerate kinase [Conexibacter sp.]